MDAHLRLGAYQHLLSACSRLVASVRVAAPAEAVAAQPWTMVHGFLSLELARHYEVFDDPVRDVLEPMAVHPIAGMGAGRRKAKASLRAGARA